MSFVAQRHLKSFLHDHMLIDAWKILHPQVIDYAFYSAVHKSYSRIDFFLIPQASLPNVVNTHIDTMAFSSHALISIIIELSSPRRPPGTWSLDTSLLKDPIVKADKEHEIAIFFQTNHGLVLNPFVLWEPHKSYVRGISIKQGHRTKKASESQYVSLIDIIHTLENRHKLHKQLID